MTTKPISPSVTVTLFIVITVIFSSSSSSVHGLGSASTIAISYGNGTVCGIISGETNQRIECYRNGETRNIAIEPNISFESISGGRNFFCGLRSGGISFLCWNSDLFQQKRIYFNESVALKDLNVGDDQVCAIENGTSIVRCWWRGSNQQNQYLSPSNEEQFQSITSGRGFSCGILMSNGTVRCWGVNSNIEIANQFGNFSMSSLVAGDSHVCGLNATGFLCCRGNNSQGQLNVPLNSGPFEFSELALGVSHSCAIRRTNGSVVCWGAEEFSSNELESLSFESIVAGLNFTCGLTTRNLSIVCWGPGWSMNTTAAGMDLPLPKIIPGPCTRASCSCGIYPDSETFCSGSGNICRRTCQVGSTTPPPPPLALPSPPPVAPPPPPRSSWIARNRGLLVFAIVGSVGIFSGLVTIIYCIWTGICCWSHKKIHNSVQPTITGGGNGNGSQMTSGPFTPPFSRSSTIRRQSSRAMRRQRSGTSSKHADRAEEFTLSELAAATDNFSLVNKIGAGSFGTVYKGKLPDGREVAIKRGETGPRTKKFQEKESAFQSELAFLSRLHHKHLVGLVGFCEEKDERLLVYEYMKNGAIYDHIHSKSNVDKDSSVLNSWKMRIKRAIFRNEEDEGSPVSVVDFAVPKIMAGELDKILDARVGQPGINEAEAVELVAYTALHCVHMEGKERPSMIDIVANLESALAICDESHGSISSATFSIRSE
ncbi:Serine/threonine-protein kinase-like protein [Thalictrum thalictroides]|uniref:Serine/threonine-protein kinase-like protein n=1 Tax=Thalictrum thalictroides TaxID=46969 RepID=A0A7J6W5K9_THATH|nr:Serine/threonine-protein kinase-like protein [Thalictrum thalictroides]